MGRLKRRVLILLTAVAGLLMTLAGLNLIELSKSLILYTGVILMVLAILSYLTERDKKKEDKHPSQEKSDVIS